MKDTFRTPSIPSLSSVNLLRLFHVNPKWTPKGIGFFFIRLAFFGCFSIRLIRLQSIRLIEPNTLKPSTFSKKPRSRIIFSRILFQKHDSRIIFSRVLFQNQDSRILFSRVLFQNHEPSRIIYSRENIARILNRQVSTRLEN